MNETDIENLETNLTDVSFEEKEFENSLRPKRFSDYIGQNQIKENLYNLRIWILSHSFEG